MALIAPSAGTRYAGQYGPLSLAAGSPLNPQGGASITVYESDGTTAATLYTDETKSSQASSNTITTDATGTFTFYADPGIYVLSFTVGGTATTRTVEVKPWYTDGAWNLVLDAPASGGTTYTPSSGDERICAATAGAGTYTLPSPTLGARVRVTLASSSTSTATLNTPTGNIVGPNNVSATSYVLGIPGASVELVANGTDYEAVASAPVVASSWTSYTPTVGGTGWALGNGTLACAYRLIDAKTVALRIRFSLGSTTTVGSGQLTFSLPSGMTTVDATELTGLAYSTFSGTSATALAQLSAGGGATTLGATVLVISSSVAILQSVYNGGTWSSGNHIYAEGVFEIA